MAEKLLPEESAHPVCHVSFLGEREVMLATPVFTDYSVLDGECDLCFYCPRWVDFHIVRTEGYMKETAQVQMSLSLFPFAAAASVGIVLEYGFHPALYDICSPQESVHSVIHEPENKSLEFAELIGTLIIEERTMRQSQEISLTHELRKEIQVDVESGRGMSALSAGLPGRRVWKQGNSRVHPRGEAGGVRRARHISEKEMKQLSIK